MEEDIDWWSKYHASVGDLAKAGMYLEKGYDKIIVSCRTFVLVSWC